MVQGASEFRPRDPRYADRVRASFGRHTAMATISARMVFVKPGAVEIEMPYQKNLTQQDGFIHGGIIAAIMDTACGYAALSLMPTHSEVLAVEFKINFMSPAVGDKFIARGKVLRPGPTITFCAGDVLAVKGKREKTVATALESLICRKDPYASGEKSL